MSWDEISGIELISYMPMPKTGVEAPPQQEDATRPEGIHEPSRVVQPRVASAEAPRPARPAAEERQAEIGPRVRLGRGSWVSPTASVVGDVIIGQEVFVGPAASVRGDSGARVYIGDQSNVQDGAVVHALEDKSIRVGEHQFAVYVGRRVSLAHQALVHGPAAIQDDCFVGFGATVVNSTLGRGCVVMHRAYVSDVDVPAGRLVPVGAVVDTAERARSLPRVSHDLQEFAERVVEANRRYAREYGESARR